ARARRLLFLRVHFHRFVFAHAFPTLRICIRMTLRRYCFGNLLHHLCGNRPTCYFSPALIEPFPFEASPLRSCAPDSGAPADSSAPLDSLALSASSTAASRLST